MKIIRLKKREENKKRTRSLKLINRLGKKSNKTRVNYWLLMNKINRRIRRQKEGENVR
jgi:hypothetical protein